MATIIFWVVVAAIASFGGFEAWTGFKEHISAPYVAAQIKSDQAVVDAANAKVLDANTRAGNARADTDQCTSKLDEATASIVKWQDTAARNLAAAREARAQNDVLKAKMQSTNAQYQAIIDTPKKYASCQAELSAVDKLLRDAARARSRK